MGYTRTKMHHDYHSHFQSTCGGHCNIWYYKNLVMLTSIVGQGNRPRLLW